MKHIIREALPSDCSAIANLIEQLGYPISPKEMLQQIKLYTDKSDYKVFVMECDGNVVAVISIIFRDHFHRKAKYMKITSLVVDSQYRRQGIGHKLIEYVENYAANLGCDFIELTSPTYRAKLGTHDFYKNLGYEDLGDTKRYLAKKINPDSTY
ncbi:GNAT family N-acetyltransferase [Candidatus Babeliales bacterium]|nr:GNAT family N-acetyltransferase [Candidatus Babeliales bacterium]MCF7899771.1 GNAT family N-acetyltransferase [Candidatus Babeliales bacterium]